MSCPKPPGILEPAGVPRILCKMYLYSSFCILFSWSKLSTPYYLPAVSRQSIPSASSPPGFGNCAWPSWARSFNPHSGTLGTFLRKWIVTQLVCVTFSIPWKRVLNCILSEKKMWIYPCFGKKGKDWVLQSLEIAYYRGQLLVYFVCRWYVSAKFYCPVQAH